MCKPRQLRRNRRIALVLCLLGLGLVYRAQIMFEVNAHNGVGLFALLHQGLYAGAAGQNGTGLMPAMSVRVGQACFVPSPPACPMQSCCRALWWWWWVGLGALTPVGGLQVLCAGELRDCVNSKRCSDSLTARVKTLCVPRHWPAHSRAVPPAAAAAAARCPSVQPLLPPAD